VAATKLRRLPIAFQETVGFSWAGREAPHESPSLETRISGRLDRLLSGRGNGRAVLRVAGIASSRDGELHNGGESLSHVPSLAFASITILALAGFWDLLRRIDVLRSDVGFCSVKMTDFSLSDWCFAPDD
jgi:hypothetical protein